MRPLRARALVPAVAMAIAVALGAGAARPAAADIDGDVLIAPDRGLRLELPRGWRASEVSAYPGVVVWLSRTTPRITILVTVDPVVGPCRDPLRFCDRDADLAINVVRQQLDVAGFQVTAQAQSRTPELEYQAGNRFLRHAVLVIDDQVVSIILAADTAAIRAAQGRMFERLVTSVRPLAPPVRRPTSEDEREEVPR
jgi:hypothetical protein